MIEYSVLCQAIEEWKAGQRPASGPHAAASGDSYEVVEEMDSGIVMLDESDESEDEYAQQQAEAVEGDGQIEGDQAYQGESEYAATGDQAYSAETDYAQESDPETGEVAEEHEVPAETEGEEAEDEIPIDTTPETKPSGD
jgi:hypothetical protein